MYERMTLKKWDDDLDGEIEITGTYIYEESETRGEGSCEITIPESESFVVESIMFNGKDVTGEYDDLSAWCLENLPE